MWRCKKWIKSSSLRENLFPKNIHQCTSTKLTSNGQCSGQKQSVARGKTVTMLSCLHGRRDGRSETNFSNKLLWKLKQNVQKPPQISADSASKTGWKNNIKSCNYFIVLSLQSWSQCIKAVAKTVLISYYIELLHLSCQNFNESCTF